MSEPGIAAVEVRAAGAYARADMLAPRVAPFFTPPGGGQVGDRKDGRPAALPVPSQGTGSGSRGDGAAGPFMAFMAQAIAQLDAPTRPPLSAFLAGTSAYRQAAPPPVTADVEIASPFPRLSSGKSLDLSV